MKKILFFVAFLLMATVCMQVHAQTTSCTYSIVMSDEYGDGWNDGTLQVRQGTNVVGSYTLDDGFTGAATFTVQNGLTYTLYWSSGEYDDEVSFSILDASGTQIYSVMNAEDISGTFFTFTGNCSDCIVGQPRLASVGGDEVTISWDAASTNSYEVNIALASDDMDETNVITTTDTFYTFTNLTPATDYVAYVRVNCGTEYSVWRQLAVSTSQIPAQLPYVFGFEDETESGNWQFIQTGTNKWYIGSAVANQGTNSLYISNDNGTSNAYNNTSTSTAWAYRDIDMGNSAEYALSFRYRNQGESNSYDYLRVYIGTPTTNLPSGAYNGVTIPGATLLGVFSGQSAWQEANFTIPPTFQGVQRLYFLWWNDASAGSNPPAAIDNISIMGSDCGSPSVVALDSVTSSTIAFHFTPAFETDNSWQVLALAPNDTIDESMAIDVYDVNYEFTDLQGNTNYRIIVRTNCGSEFSVWSTALNARTLCVPSTLPFIENFESYAVNDRPECWSFPVTYNSDPYVTSSQFVSGSKSMHFASLTTNPTTAVTPQIDADIETLRVKFQLKAESTTSSGTFEVGVMSDPTDVSTFESVQTIQPANTSWNEYVISFNSVQTTGPNRCVAFRQHSNASNYYYWLDDVEISLIPSCTAPANLTLESLSGDAATINWTADETEGTWEVLAYAGNEAPDFTQAEIVNDNTYSLNNLTGNTTYNFYVRTVCASGDGYSEWVHITFMTPSSSLAEVPYFCDFSDETENAEWTILNGSETNKWYIGVPTGSTDSVLFVSQDGAANTYTNTTSAVWAYRDIQFGDGAEFILNFKWKGHGESSYDYMKVFIGTPVTVTPGEYANPTGATQLGSNYMNLQDNWQYFSATLDGSYANSVRRLYFLWKNDGSVSNPPAVSIDSIEITSNNCGRPYNVMASNVAPFSAEVSFTPATENDNAWEYVVVNGTADPNSATPVTVADTTFIIDNLNAETSYTVYVRTDCGGGDYSEWSIPTAFTTLVACPTPVNVRFENITTSTVDVNWDELGYANTWNIEYGPAGFAQGQGTTETVTDLPYTLTGLQTATTYTVYVQADCGNGETSAWTSAVNFVTACEGINQLPYTENFDAVSGSTTTTVSVNNLPNCWSNISGTYSSYAGYPMVYNSSTYAASGTNAVRFYTATTTSIDYGDQYAIMPNVDVNTYPMSTLQVTFNARKNSTSYAAFYLVVGVMEGSSASSFVPVDTVVVTEATYDEYTVNFSNYDGTGDRIAIMAPHNTSVSYNQGYIDNVTIEEIPSCSKPAALTVVNTTATDVTLQWQETGDAAEWEIEYGTAGFDSGTGVVVSAYTNPFTVTGLNSGEIYEFYVRSVCSVAEQSDWRGPVTAAPGSYNMPVTGWDTIYSCGAVIYDNGGATGDYANYCDGYLVIYPETEGSSVTVSGTILAETSTYDYLVIYDGASNTNVLYHSSQSTNTLVNFGPFTSSTGPLTLYFHTDVSGVYAGLEIHASCVSCMPVSGVAASNVGTSSATINWNGTADSYNVVYGPTGFDVETEGTLLTTSNTSIDLTGLTSLTSYDVYVQSDCGGGDVSNWTNISFATAACEAADQCTYTFTCIDGYGDGWNGAYVTVEQNGTVVATVEAGDHQEMDVTTTDNIPVSLCDGISTSLVWHSGDYDSECTLTVTDPNGNVVFTQSSMSFGTLATFTTNCSGAPVVTCDAPTNVAASNITTAGATITWTAGGSETAWNLQYKTAASSSWSNSIAVNGTPSYNLSGLTAGTAYQVRVQANCGDATSTWAEGTFTTSNGGGTACDAPTNLTATGMTVNSAVLNWNQSDASVNAWVVSYKKSSDNTWTNVNVSSKPYTLNGLEYNTEYNVKVAANCDGTISDYSSVVNFRTAGDGVEDYVLTNSINLYPNPATTTITVQSANGMMNKVEVYDVYGKMLNMVEVNDAQVTMNIANYAAGTYFVRVYTEGGMTTKRIVKR